MALCKGGHQRQQAQTQQRTGRLRQRHILRIEGNLVDGPGRQQEEGDGKQRRDQQAQRSGRICHAVALQRKRAHSGQHGKRRRRGDHWGLGAGGHQCQRNIAASQDPGHAGEGAVAFTAGGQQQRAGCDQQAEHNNRHVVLLKLPGIAESLQRCG